MLNAILGTSLIINLERVNVLSRGRRSGVGSHAHTPSLPIYVPISEGLNSSSDFVEAFKWVNESCTAGKISVDHIANSQEDLTVDGPGIFVNQRCKVTQPQFAVLSELLSSAHHLFFYYPITGKISCGFNKYIDDVCEDANLVPMPSVGDPFIDGKGSLFIERGKYLRVRYTRIIQWTPLNRDTGALIKGGLY